MISKFNPGDQKSFLDYTIKHFTNGDGIVLSARRLGLDYETHLGNFKDIDTAQKYAVLHFMIRRPEIFAHCIVNRLMISNHSGTVHEWFLFKKICAAEKIKIPKEVKCSRDANAMIHYNGKPIKL